MTAPRGYRTSIEVLRDILRAADSPTPKTRIIGIANLNPRSFREYAQFCTDHGLLGLTEAGYVSTLRGKGVLTAIEVILARTVELETAVQHFHRSIYGFVPVPAVQAAALRQLSRWMWNDGALGTGGTAVLSRPVEPRTEPSDLGPGASPPRGIWGASLGPSGPPFRGGGGPAAPSVFATVTVRRRRGPARRGSSSR